MNPFLHNVERWHVALLVTAVVAAALTARVSPVSLFIGGALMGVDLWAMGRIFHRLVRPAAEQRTAWVLGLMVLKFALFLSVLAALFWRVPIDPVGFAVGVTVLLVACVVEALRQGMRPT